MEVDAAMRLCASYRRVNTQEGRTLGVATKAEAAPHTKHLQARPPLLATPLLQGVLLPAGLGRAAATCDTSNGSGKALFGGGETSWWGGDSAGKDRGEQRKIEA